MVNVNIPEETWIPFLMQSVEMRVSASERIRDFVKSELTEKRTKVKSNEHKTT